MYLFISSDFKLQIKYVFIKYTILHIYWRISQYERKDLDNFAFIYLKIRVKD